MSDPGLDLADEGQVEGVVLDSPTPGFVYQ